jgi:hypothetical protein
MHALIENDVRACLRLDRGSYLARYSYFHNPLPTRDYRIHDSFNQVA